MEGYENIVEGCVSFLFVYLCVCSLTGYT